MGIWKWMTKGKSSRVPGRADRVGKLVPAIVLVCLIPAGTMTAAPSVGFRLIPSWSAPLGDTPFQYGVGGALAIDLMPVSFFGFVAQGEYVNLGLQNVSSIHLVDGSLGLAGVWRIADRWSARAELFAGVYTAKGGVSLSGISAGARASATYAISPELAVSLQAAYRTFLYRPEPFLNALSVGAAVEVNLSNLLGAEPHVSIATEKQDPVFPVFYSWYDENNFALVKVKNDEDADITDVTASFFLEQYMGQPKLCATSKQLGKGESFDVPVKAFFNESMLGLTEKVEAEGKIIVEYRVLGSKRRAEVPIVISICDRNAMNWDDDRHAAAFVSSKDPAALWFSKYVSAIASDRMRPGINQNIQKAMAIFESLKTYGINYVVDPTSAYTDKGQSSIDFLQYPYQTLMYRGGDCDDLSILYCSLLEAIGVKAAFITIPGHIYVAFDSGLTEVEAKESFYAPTQLLYRDGHAWVPLEITLTKEDFNKAWRIGAKEWNDAESRNAANLFPVEESWQVYKPVSVPGAASRFNLPDEEKAVAALDASLDVYVEREIRPQIRAYQALLARSDDPSLHNRLGVLYGTYGMFRLARQQFILAARANDVNAWINLGNVAYMEQNYADAIGFYNYVLSLDQKQPVALLGAARAYYELEEFQYSDALYAALGASDAELSAQYAYLGSFFSDAGRAWNLSDRLSTTVWSVPKGASAEVDSSEYIDSSAYLAENVPPPAILTKTAKKPDLPDLPNLPDSLGDKESDDYAVIPEQELAIKPPSRKNEDDGSDDEPVLPAASSSGGLVAMLSVPVLDTNDALLSTQTTLPNLGSVAPPVLDEKAMDSRAKTAQTFTATAAASTKIDEELENSEKEAYAAAIAEFTSVIGAPPRTSADSVEEETVPVPESPAPQGTAIAEAPATLPEPVAVASLPIIPAAPVQATTVFGEHAPVSQPQPVANVAVLFGPKAPAASIVPPSSRGASSAAAITPVPAGATIGAVLTGVHQLPAWIPAPPIGAGGGKPSSPKKTSSVPMAKPAASSAPVVPAPASAAVAPVPTVSSVPAVGKSPAPAVSSVPRAPAPVAIAPARSVPAASKAPLPAPVASSVPVADIATTSNEIPAMGNAPAANEIPAQAAAIAASETPAESESPSVSETPASASAGTPAGAQSAQLEQDVNESAGIGNDAGQSSIIWFVLAGIAGIGAFVAAKVLKGRSDRKRGNKS
jgi:tetratricopeptide (TPR) repeat protein